MEEFDSIIKAIAQTGFPFQHEVSMLFRNHGWDVRHGTYYIDDVTQSVREIDIVAEKSAEVEGLQIHTVCIVSCKMSRHPWALLAHSRQTDDWLRQCELKQLVVANDEILRHMTQVGSWPWDDVDAVAALENAEISILLEPEQTIFAFQEVDKAAALPRDDKSIFASIVSLLKAQAHEMAAHAQGTKRAVYQYNLLSAVDSELVRLDFPEEPGDPVALKVGRQTYLADYIINRQPISAPIRFVAKPALEAGLAELDALHELNVQYFPRFRTTFFVDCLADPVRRKLFESAVVDGMQLRVAVALRKPRLSGSSLRLGWDQEANRALFQIEGASPADVEALNGDEPLREHLRSLLRDHFAYHGQSHFAGVVDFIIEELIALKRAVKTNRGNSDG